MPLVRVCSQGGGGGAAATAGPGQLTLGMGSSGGGREPAPTGLGRGSCCTAPHRCPPYARPGSPLQGAQARGRAWRVAPGGEGGCRPPPLPPPRSGHRVTGCPCTAGVPSAAGALEPGGPRQGRGCAIWEASGSRDPALNRGQSRPPGGQDQRGGTGVTPSPQSAAVGDTEAAAVSTKSCPHPTPACGTS